MQISHWKDGWTLWELIDQLRKIGALASNNVFRGHSDSEWKLTPSLYRRKINFEMSKPMTKDEIYHILEERMLTSFFNRAAMLLPNFRRSPALDRIVAQHYGVPTQLLDWTLDPLIALYFAVHGDNNGKDCALFYIQPSNTTGIGDHINFPWKSNIVLLNPPVIDERIQRQKSVFTIQNFGNNGVFTPLDERDLNTDQVHYIGKVIIPAERRLNVLHHLKDHGVDSSVIYPGLQGIGKAVSDFFE